MTPFEDLLKELGELLESTFIPDQYQSCMLNFPEHEINVQIDLDPSGDRILVGSHLGLLPIGPYRNRIFKHALIDNGTSISPRGVLAFCEKSASLVLFQYLFLAGLNGEKLRDFLYLFIPHAKKWTEAIYRGEIPEMGDLETGSKDSFFGLVR